MIFVTVVWPMCQCRCDARTIKGATIDERDPWVTITRENTSEENKSEKCCTCVLVVALYLMLCSSSLTWGPRIGDGGA